MGGSGDTWGLGRGFSQRGRARWAMGKGAAALVTARWWWRGRGGTEDRGQPRGQEPDSRGSELLDMSGQWGAGRHLQPFRTSVRSSRNGNRGCDGASVTLALGTVEADRGTRVCGKVQGATGVGDKLVGPGGEPGEGARCSRSRGLAGVRGRPGRCGQAGSSGLGGGTEGPPTVWAGTGRGPRETPTVVVRLGEAPSKIDNRDPTRKGVKITHGLIAQRETQTHISPRFLLVFFLYPFFFF